MSASSKKKLRREQEAAVLTEKQLAAQKEAKKLNLYTIAFVTVMVAVLVIAIVVGVNQTITSSGLREKNTVALTVDGHEINNVEMNYFYMDAINNFYSSYGSYASIFGLDVTAPLNEQVVDEETGKTWADDFLDSAKSSAKAAYALADAAKEAGFTISQEDQETIDTTISNLDAYAIMGGFSDGDSYLKAIYGNGASSKSYKEYVTLVTLAGLYQNHYTESLTYEDADLRAVEAENFDAYSSYSYNTYYLSVSRFLEGGTTAEDGTTTYTEDEKAAAQTAAEEAAKALTGEEITSAEALDAAIAALEINQDTTASSIDYVDTLYTSVSSTYRDWIANTSRKAGDKTYIASTSTDEDGNESISGYTVIFYTGSTNNTFALKNVRHILAAFEGGTTDSTTGVTTYSDEEKAAAKTDAEAILNEWKAGEATEDSFAALANEKSDDGDGTTGGLYENIYPGQMVESFEDWCYGEGRKAGDTGIIESEYGYHVMYFVDDAQQSYRDYLIENELRSADAEEWYANLLEAASVTDGDYTYIRKDLVLSNS